jgi:hypothetical protein
MVACATRIKGGEVGGGCGAACATIRGTRTQRSVVVVQRQPAAVGGPQGTRAYWREESHVGRD